MLVVMGMATAAVLLAIPIVVVGNNFAQAWEEREVHFIMYRIQVRTRGASAQSHA